jgi:uncharacterized protein YlxW (UPF0749 family)
VNKTARLSITLVAFMIGVLAMAQFAAQQRLNSKRTLASGADGALLVSNLVEGNTRLRQEVSELDAQLDNYRSVGGQASLQAMTDDLSRLQVLNGVAPVYGPGVRVTYDGPATVLDLEDLINELRNAGAEAIALNNQRIIASTILLPKGDGSIAVDGNDIHRPYVFVAIGDADTLQTALLRPGGLLAVLSNSRQGITVNVEKRDRVDAPTHTALGSFQYQYAVPVK